MHVLEGVGTRCPTHLLDDEPAREDEFGAHQRLADAIAETVEQDLGGRALAIIGPYGSGKSTVIALVRGIVEGKNGRERDRRALFTFDAWAHQGDPLRRSFLEELFEFLADREWILRDGPLNDAVDALAHRHQISTAVPQATITWQGVTVAATLPIAACAAAFASHWPPAAWFVLTPLATALGLWARAAATGDPDALKPNRMAELFITKPEAIVETATIMTPDPTSVEFRQLFVRIIDQALQPSDRRLAIVLDNLDRLASDQAMSLFATMRTFFDLGSPLATTHRQAVMRRLWLVVPFDSSWIRQLSDGSKKHVDHVGESFLEKSFQARFYVSEPILFGWRAYLLKLLEQACPLHTADFGTIFLLYQRAVATGQASTTPRLIKQFVNRLAVSHRQWQDTIPVATQAAYLLFAGAADDASIPLIKGTLFDEAVLNQIDDPEWQRNAAALFYNLPPPSALHALLDKPILEAIAQGESATLSELKSVNGFRELCETLVAQNLDSWTATSTVFANACYVLSEVDVLGFGMIGSRLRSGFRRVSEWQLTVAQQSKGIVRLLESFPESSRRDAMATYFSRAAAGESSEAESTKSEGLVADKRKWLAGSATIIEWAVDQFGESDVREALHVGKSATGYLALVEAAMLPDGILPPTLAHVLAPQCSPADVLAALLSRLRAESRDKVPLQLLSALTRVPIRWPYAEIVRAIAQDLGTGDVYPAERTARAIDTLVFIGAGSYDSSAVDSLKALSANGHLLHQMAALVDAADPFGRALLPYVLYNGTDTIVGNGESALTRIRELVAAPPKFTSIVAALVRSANAYGRTTELFTVLRASQARQSLAVPVLVEGQKHLASDSPELVSIVIESYDFLAAPNRMQSADLQKLLDGVCVNPTFDERLTSDGFDAGRLPLYLARLNTSLSPCSAPFIAMLCDALAKVDKATWLDQIKSFGPLVRVAITLVGAGQRGWLHEPFLDALTDHAASLLIGAAPSEDFLGAVPVLLEALDGDGRATLLRSVRDRMDTGALDGVIAVYGGLLVDSGLLREEGDRFARDTLFRLLEQPDAVGINWVGDVLRSDGYLDTVKDQTERSLARRASALLEREDIPPELRNTIVGIRAQLPEPMGLEDGE
jgi:energy-coupling factor transporter ATP-binding protein EcfA2